MNFSLLTKPTLAMVSALSMVGCSTPQPAIKQANHTASLMGLLDKEASQFRQVVGSSQEALVDSMARRRESFGVFQTSAALLDRSRASAGDTRTTALRAQLLSDADSVSDTRNAAAAAPEELRKRVEALLTPLPSTTAAVTDAQVKAAAMGTELSADTRRNELLAFFEAVKDSLRENRKKIEKAKEDATKAKEAADAAADKDAPKEVK